jgi:hypothetical protein
MILNNDGLEDLLVLDMAIEDPVQKQLFVQTLITINLSTVTRFNLFINIPGTVYN